MRSASLNEEDNPLKYLGVNNDWTLEGKYKKYMKQQDTLSQIPEERKNVQVMSSLRGLNNVDLTNFASNRTKAMQNEHKEKFSSAFRSPDSF